MVSAVVALLVGILVTIAVLVFLANVIPVPAPSCAAGGGGAGTTMTPSASLLPPPAPTPAVPSMTPAPSSGGASGQSSLASGGMLTDGQSLVSPDGNTKFIYQYGQLQILQGATQLWISPNEPLQNGVVMLRTDGTFGLFASQYSVTPVWDSKTSNKGMAPYTLTLQNDGNLLLFDSTPSVMWSAPIGAPPSSSGMYTPSTMWVGNSGTGTTGTVSMCQMGCTLDPNCAGFARKVGVDDADVTGQCFPVSKSAWTAPGAQQPSNTWQTFVKS